MSHESLLTLLAILLLLAGASAWLVVTAARRARRPSFAPAGATAATAAVERFVPESRYVSVAGARLHYIQGGTGPDIVLVHGIGASIFAWRFLFPLLQSGHRVTALDLPGFGLSSKEVGRDYGLDAQAEIVAKALDELKIEKPILVGSSMGGAIALWLAKRFPERFTKVAVLAPATDWRLAPAQVKHLAHAAPLMRRALNRRVMKLILGRIVARRDLITDEAVDSYLAPFLDGGDSIRSFWSAMSLLADRRLPEALVAVRAKVLVLYGEKDLMVPRRVIENLVRILPNADLATHPEGGHHIMEDEPEWTAHQIESLHS